MVLPPQTHQPDSAVGEPPHVPTRLTCMRMPRAAVVIIVVAVLAPVTAGCAPDPGDARYVYELGPAGLAKIDTPTWDVRWTTAIRLPQFPHRELSGLMPVFFHGYTEVLGWHFPAMDGPPTPPTDQTITAVSDAGQVLVACTIPRPP